ncbi:unnamed protein product [Effrenium voratum]|nr:unnamed protein product [Effrenium voratum]
MVGSPKGQPQGLMANCCFCFSEPTRRCFFFFFSEIPICITEEMNCWPWPHNGSLLLPRGAPLAPLPATGNGNGTRFRIPWHASQKAEHHEEWRYPYPHRSSGSIASSEVCREWLLQRAEPNWFDRGSDSPLFPFLNAGTFIGRAVSVLRIIRIMLRLYQQTGEIDDQALFGLTLLQNPQLGLVDTMGELFLSLHGHLFRDLERFLCHEDYWAPERPSSGRSGRSGRFPGQPPRLRRRSIEAPSILHFNGNGKRLLARCVRAFQQRRVLSGWDGRGAQCTFYDEDWGHWRRYTVMASVSISFATSTRKFALCATGVKGKVEVERAVSDGKDGYSVCQTLVEEGKRMKTETVHYPFNGVPAEFEAFLKSQCEETSSSPSSPEEALLDLELIEALLASGKTDGQPVPVGSR